MNIFISVSSFLLLVSTTITGLSIHPALGEPTIFINPTCAPAGSVIGVVGNGFKPNSAVTYKFVDPQSVIQLYGYFDTDSTGGFNEITIADVPEGHYKLYFGDDANNDSEFDAGAKRVATDINIPCGGASNLIVPTQDIKQEQDYPQCDDKGSVTPCIDGYGGIMYWCDDPAFNSAPPGAACVPTEADWKGFIETPPGGNVTDGIPTTEPVGNMNGFQITGNLTDGISTTEPMTQSPSTFSYDPTTNLKEFGVFFGPIQKHFGVYHNEHGVFLPWTTLCPQIQAYLLQSCSSLMNPDGTLTAMGNTAVECISNGAIVTGAAAMFNLPVDTIKGILGALATPTGCGNIVDLNTIPNSPDIQRLIQMAGTVAQ